MEKSHGILVGSDRAQEWLLEWWWQKYSRHNRYPVAFIDFGMSEEAVERFKTRGRVIPFPYEVDVRSTPDLQAQAESVYGQNVTHFRSCWFKKPLAFTLSPFEKTLWLDNDCEVLGPLDQLFEFEGLALAKEISGACEYNSGVVVYEKNHPVIQEWALASQTSSDRYIGDQELLCDLLQRRQFPVQVLPPEFNWRMSQGINIHALIIHWIGSGKEIIQKFGGLS